MKYCLDLCSQETQKHMENIKQVNRGLHLSTQKPSAHYKQQAVESRTVVPTKLAAYLTALVALGTWAALCLNSNLHVKETVVSCFIILMALGLKGANDINNTGFKIKNR